MTGIKITIEGLMLEDDQCPEVIQGDCLKVMTNIPDKSVDMILSDLPYGTTRSKWDTPINLDALWSEYKRVIKDNGAILLFAQTPFDKVLGCSNLPMLRYEWIWEKTQATGFYNANHMPLKAHENILVFYKHRPVYHPQKTTGHRPVHSYTKYLETQNKTTVYGKATKELSGGGNTDRFPRDVIVFKSDKQTSHLHSAQKPVALLEYLIKTYTNEGDIVLDNCMGSGSTGVACLATGRKFIGIEIDFTQFDIAATRLSDFLAKINCNLRKE